MTFPKLYVASFIGILLLGFVYFFKSANGPDRALLVQLISNSPTLNSMRESAAAPINAIIKEELGLSKEYDFDFFYQKPVNRLTLYYLWGIHEDGQEELFSALTALQRIGAPRDAFIATEVHFFGDKQDELVILIKDPRDELSHLNAELKTIAHYVNDQYKQKHNHDLYNLSKSEQFGYLPHIGLGRIRTQSITDRIEDKAQTEMILGRIKNRIIKTVTEDIVAKILTETNSKLSFQKISIFELPKGIYIKDYEYAAMP